MNLEVVSKVRLVGVVLSSDLRWQENTSYIYKKAVSRMWLLRRMKTLELEDKFILDYYLKEIRSVCEHGIPVWNSGLTRQQVHELEKIQRVALKNNSD